jgi:hypothetical protein
MTTQDETLKSYYSAMTDADLLNLAKNQRSYIEAAKDDGQGTGAKASEPAARTGLGRGFQVVH